MRHPGVADSRVMVPPSCCTSSRVSREPRPSFASSGHPIPLSSTTSVNSVGALRTFTQTVPAPSSGNACFKALVTNSFTIRPMRVAFWVLVTTRSASTSTAMGLIPRSASPSFVEGRLSLARCLLRRVPTAEADRSRGSRRTPASVPHEPDLDAALPAVRWPWAVAAADRVVALPTSREGVCLMITREHPQRLAFSLSRRSPMPRRASACLKWIIGPIWTAAATS
jgi:hypothetical protein